jgi:hypothetical protein
MTWPPAVPQAPMASIYCGNAPPQAIGGGTISLAQTRHVHEPANFGATGRVDEIAMPCAHALELPGASFKLINYKLGLGAARGLLGVN